jgi:hypothetical protein
MELLVLAGLISGGYFINRNKEESSIINISDEEEPENNKVGNHVGNDIYDSNDFLLNKKAEFAKADAVFKQSQDFPHGNIVPFYSNTIGMNSYENMIKNEAFDKNLIYSVINSFDDETKEIIKTMTGSRNRMKTDWESLYGSPEVCIEDLGQTLLPNRGHEANMTHNNMVPFFGGRIKQNITSDRLSADKLERFTGQFKLNQEQKTEVGPFFEPVRELTNINGSHEQRDMSRYIPSNIGKCNNEVPFEQITVGRGLNKGYTSQGSGGFHEMLRILPPTKAELQINAVVEQEGRINSGKDISKRANIGATHKNRQTILVENKNGERNFTSVGAVVADEARPEILLRDTSRKVSESYTGVAKNSAQGTIIASKMKPTNKRNYTGTPYRNVIAADKKTASYDYGKSGIENRTTERVLSGCKTQTAPAKSIVNSIVSFFTDAAKQTKKQAFVPNQAMSINATTNVSARIAAPLDQARTTIRETTEDMQHQGTAVANKKNIAMPSDTARTTIRETTEDMQHQGTAVANKKNIAGPQDQAKTTIRETTENLDYLGQAIPTIGKNTAGVVDAIKTTTKQTTMARDYVGGMSLKKKQISYDPKDVARTTMKETTLITGHVANVEQINKKQITYDPEDTARTTIKETTLITGFIPTVNMPHKKQITYDPEDIARGTIKQSVITENYMRNVNSTVHQAGKGYATTTWEAKATNKQELSDNSYTGIAARDTNLTSRENLCNAQLNYNKELIAEGREFMKLGETLFNSTCNQEVNKIDSDRVNKYSAMKTSTIGNYFTPSIAITSVKNNLPECETRLDSHTLDSLKTNPLNIDISLR